MKDHMFFIKKLFSGTVCAILTYAGFLLYAFHRSFRIHQETVDRVLCWNNREGIFCSQVEVGHNGTTLLFQVIPKEVGTAGPIAPPILSAGDPAFQTLSFFPFFWLIPLAVLLFLLIILWIFHFRNKKIEGVEKKGVGQ